MFVDISTYVGHWPFRNLKYNTLEGLDKLAQEHDITHMVVSNLNGFFYKDANVANLELLEELKNYKGKTEFIPFAIVNPSYVEWERDAREMVAAGFKGFELAPIYHGYSLAPEMLFDEYMPKHRALQVMNLAEELGVPVRICSSFENFRGRSPRDSYDNITGDQLYALLSKNMNVTVFVTSFHPLAGGEKFTALIKERKNTYFDPTSFEVFNSKAAEAILKVIDQDQLCYGSLSPFNYMEPTLLRIAYAPEFDYEAIKTNGAKAFKSL